MEFYINLNIKCIFVWLTRKTKISGWLFDIVEILYSRGFTKEQ